MLQRRSRESCVDCRDGQTTLFCRRFNLSSPFGHSIVERENASCKPEADIMIEPALQSCTFGERVR